MVCCHTDAGFHRCLTGAQLVAHPADGVEKIDGADDAEPATSQSVRSPGTSRYYHLLSSCLLFCNRVVDDLLDIPRQESALDSICPTFECC